MRGIKIPQYEFGPKIQGGVGGGRICGTLRYVHVHVTLGFFPNPRIESSYCCT